MINIIKQNNKLYIKYINKILGWGVFTEDPIKEGDIVELCYCVPDNYETSPLKDYVFGIKNSTDVYHCLGFGAIYNHSDDPNIKWRLLDDDNRIIEFKAIRDIEPHEELRHNYGKAYWEHKKEKKII